MQVEYEKFLLFSTNIWLFYLENYTKYSHSYCGTPTGTRMRSIKWCHFQRPWMIRAQTASRAHHYSTLNISATGQDRDIVAMKY